MDMAQSQYTQGYEDGKRAKRDELIRRMDRRGYSQVEIATIVLVSRQRVGQILDEDSTTERATA
jgi:predicted transcriptional regulator